MRTTHGLARRMDRRPSRHPPIQTMRQRRSLTRRHLDSPTTPPTRQGTPCPADDHHNLNTRHINSSNSSQPTPGHHKSPNHLTSAQKPSDAGATHAPPSPNGKPTATPSNSANTHQKSGSTGSTANLIHLIQGDPPVQIAQKSLFDDDSVEYSVRQIPNKDAHWLLLNIHYAKRIPSISYTFGLFERSELVGVVCYGTPASSPLRRGICGEKWETIVLELNRLCLINNKPNEASRLVGFSLRLIPSPRIVISFADTEQNHLGIVYQATNFLYTGLSAKRTDWKIRGQEHLHGITIADKVRHSATSRAEALRAVYGEDFYIKERSRKHRYVTFVGNKKQKRQLISDLRYPIVPYPKENT
jgi:hypothetical protein